MRSEKEVTAMKAQLEQDFQLCYTQQEREVIANLMNFCDWVLDIKKEEQAK